MTQISSSNKGKRTKYKIGKTQLINVYLKPPGGVTYRLEEPVLC